MSIKRMGIAGVLTVLALNVWAAPGSAPASAGSKPKFDVTGTWNAKIESGGGPAVNMVFVLKQEKEKLTGSVSTDGGPPVEITDGKALRTTVYFSVSTTMPARPAPDQNAGPAPKPMTMVTKYTGTVSGNEITFSTAMGGMGGMGGGMGGMGGGMGGGGRMGGGGGGMGGPPGGGGGGMGGPPGGGGGMGGPPGGGGMGGGMGGMKTTFTAVRQ